MNDNLFESSIDWDSFSVKKTKVSLCDFSDIRVIFEENHYKQGNMGGSISFCFNLVYLGNCIGGAVYGPPRHDIYGDKTTDLRRFALVDDAPKNTESYFLGKTIKLIKKHGLADKILTFADETQGHQGIIYKACNFKYMGETTPSKHIEWKGKQYHMRSLTVDRDYSYKLRDAIKTGEAIVVNGKCKHKYIYDINDKRRSAH